MSERNRYQLTFKYLAAGAAVVFILWLFLFGKLFPYSLLLPGFEKYEMENIILYSQKGSQYEIIKGADTLIAGVENFHQLEFLTKPELFLFRDSLSYIKRSPSKARFCTFPNSKVFITPWAQAEAVNGDISLKIYLEHELSHSLIFQNAGFTGALRYPDWLLEGIGVYSSSQMGTASYPGKKLTYSLIAEGNFMPPSAYKTGKEDKVRLDVPSRINFIYSEFACIVDYLIIKYGRERFINYATNLIREKNHDHVFLAIFGQEFDSFLDEFREYVKNEAQPLH